ncbi:GGDEF domain-containing protein [Vibrio sp. SCSIO 43137]|uniref:GGDEF domain-containing protein n=1 Tax=Vibrio sp. SCSIO 43137 TaxID=3021011 RepID=UPI0023076205|nr:GGDEF domain-containing protein [Vibrio sp. SCSIO 43137]WCE28675.1 GGDEF domain-containing protein [Vibrio sp. SCSIO 43137]
MIHIPTAFVLFSLTQLACALVFGLVWYRNRQIEGLGEWACGRFILFAAFLLLAFRESTPLMFSVLLGNGLAITGLYIVWLGNARFMQRKFANTHLTFMTLLAVTMVLFAVLAQIDNGYLLRVVITSSLIALYAALSVVVFLPAYRKGDKPLVKLMICAYILLIIVHLLRVSFYLVGFGGTALSSAGTVTAYTIVGDLFVSFLIVMISLAFVVEFLLRELQHAAERDLLTGAYNRRAFYTIADNMFARAKRERASVSVLSIDLDYFKKINDTYGHNAGDKVLKSFVVTCQQLLRTPDLFARYGGEEFIVVLSDTRAQNAIKIAERIRSRFEQISPIRSIKAGEVTCSIGVASVEELADDDSINQLIEQSDQALYHAKMSGRNRVCSH